MKGIALKAFVLAVCVVAIIIITGCEEQQVSGGKMARIIAAENIQLKEQLQQYKSEIEKLKKQYDIELKKQGELLAKCSREKKSLEEQFAGKYEDQINEFFKTVAQESGKLDEENKQLKAQVEKLKAKLEKQKTQDEQTAESL
jgi:predicted nuclease with TOPRIM domain